MSTPEVIVHEDSGTLAGDIASRLLEALELAQAGGGVPQIGLTGGSIADAVHREVARRAVDSSVDWSRVVFWWGDERFVPGGSPDRNATAARAAFLDTVGVDPARVHEMPAADGALDLDAAAAAYGEELRESGSGAFDVLMLGVGPDGHVASLFPGHPALDVEDQVAVAVRESPKPPPDRISLTFSALAHSRQVWFLVSGAEKAAAVAAGLADEGSVGATPARGVRGQDSTVWLIDSAAASQL
ncbi:6-phosphogluconolactonase [Nocardioides sp. InS609-2]|uniref:6-phosphogluconolactonase n=1 Tax=Nocardioides sp. InS609-2 TaxID=2760705 RepID=UPI0018183D77|nr:6-phosphogluconolactonase [Nocardioides sp. InS609-2]MBA3780764.1 6-phosphogluconolactonase [Nocardioides sp.]